MRVFGMTALAAVLAGLCAGQARADVIFRFDTTSYGGTNAYPATIILDLDPGPDTGTFNLSGGSAFTPLYPVGGDAFRSITWTVTTTHVATPTQAPNQNLSASLTYVNGVVTSSSIAFFSNVYDDAVRISGTGPTASGYTGHEGSGCVLAMTGPGTCTVTGIWTEVPEPMTLALFAGALIPLGLHRCRAWVAARLMAAKLSGAR